MEAKIQTHQKARWFASLSNGENATEGKGKFKEIPGELSPWRRLLVYLKENNLYITGMQIRMEGKVWNLPSMADNPRFKTSKPNSYNHFRLFSGDIGKKKIPDELYCVITAIYDDFEVQLWVNEATGNESWVTIK